MKRQPSYEEFEPFCKWQRGEQQDVLEVHLQDQGFMKQHLKVTISSFGVLKITGERPLDENRRACFCKEISVSRDCKKDEIRTKFSRGILYVTIPKRIPSVLQAAQKGALKLGSLTAVVAFGAYVAYKYRQAACSCWDD